MFTFKKGSIVWGPYIFCDVSFVTTNLDQLEDKNNIIIYIRDNLMIKFSLSS